MDYIKVLEQLREIQAQCNAYNLPLALTDNAWGHIEHAMRDILTEHYVVNGYHEERAREMAQRVIDEVYDNGEGFPWNMRLLASGEIEV